MTVMLENKTEKPVLSLKDKCNNCLKGPNLLKAVVVVICTGIVIQQITTCIMKLIDIPITTYTHFDFNKTITYPSVTFCREPPYKYDKLQKYGLSVHPRFTSAWRDFNFSIPLDQVWKDITYEPEDFFVQFGLDQEMNNVEIKETIGFVHGRCYTLSPRILMDKSTKESGYSITLKHNAADVANSISTYPPGYHAYVHYTREPFTEVAVYNGGLVDSLYCNIGEMIDVKLTVNQYIMISEDGDPCNTAVNYSANECTTQFVWKTVAARVGCSGPWMRVEEPMCDNYESMRALIAEYMEMHSKHSCKVCPRFCSSYLYNGYVNDRYTSRWDSDAHRWVSTMGSAALQTQLFIYFNSMMVSVYEERYNYDWNLFLSDLGGSIGFLLGLSVIGLISILGKFWSDVIMPNIKSKYKKESLEKKPVQISAENIYQNQDFIDASNKLKLNSYEYYY